MDIEVMICNKEKEEIMLRFPNTDYIITGLDAISLGAGLLRVVMELNMRKSPDDKAVGKTH